MIAFADRPAGSLHAPQLQILHFDVEDTESLSPSWWCATPLKHRVDRHSSFCMLLKSVLTENTLFISRYHCLDIYFQTQFQMSPSALSSSLASSTAPKTVWGYFSGHFILRQENYWLAILSIIDIRQPNFNRGLSREPRRAWSVIEMTIRMCSKASSKLSKPIAWLFSQLTRR